MYEAKLSHTDEAVRLAEQAAEFGPELAGVVYRRAVVLALVGESEQSLEVLAEAFRKGYSREIARADGDLEAIRELSEFRELVAASVATNPRGGSR